MEIFFLGIVVLLFLLAVFDLTVGVSNDAVNFLTSAVGSKAASFKVVIIVASLGVFVGAAMSNGMMDVARNSIFRSENISFYDAIAIFMAVMVTNIILLDKFNSLGMPTSTTVSLVFELLGATFVVALFKISAPESNLGLGDLLNAERALSVILGIFLSVAIAFVFGTLIQFIARLIFRFEYKSRLKWKVGLFGGIACTAIVYFMLLKGIKDTSFMTESLKGWIDSNSVLILFGSFVIFTILCQILHFLRVNVLKAVVLVGTFSLAMAFAGNDLVNFIGIPLTSLASYQEFMSAGGGDAHNFMLGALNKPAQTPIYFLVGAGMIMVVSLATSKKARQVTQTTVGLSSQSQGEELFGSSRLGRALVRMSLNTYYWLREHTPAKVRLWLGSRMDNSVTQEEPGASFDLLRGAVSLMVASVLIAWGTSMKLPLSTTFVTFMVAMGTSLADRAWGRESAVFRITGVISVIGGWFITAGVAFIGAGIVVCMMHLGGVPVIIAGGVIAVSLLIRSNRKFSKKKKAEQNETLFQTILSTEDSSEVWRLLLIYINEKNEKFLGFITDIYENVSAGFIKEDSKILSKTEKILEQEKNVLKSQRRRLTLCLRKVRPETAIEKSTWFHLNNNMMMSMTYNLSRIVEVCKEHVDNNFRPLPAVFHERYVEISGKVVELLRESRAAVADGSPDRIDLLRRRCEEIKKELSSCARDVYESLHSDDASNMAVAYVYLNMLQESQEFITSLRKQLRASGKLNLEPSSYRSFSRYGASLA